MLRISFTLLLLCFSIFNAQASLLPPQDASTGTDGVFNLPSGESTLFSNADNFYNFTNFTIGETSTLNVNINGPVYIYSQQSITINGTLNNNSPDLHLIAPNFNLTGTIDSPGNLFLVGTTTNNGSSATTSNISNGSITLTSGNPNATITTGYIDTSITTLSAGNIAINGSIQLISNPLTSGPITISPSPVPLPAALWLMISGLLSLGMLKKHQTQRS